MRLQLALNVPDLAAAITFYSDMFGVSVHKQRPGYANFEITEPPLKLVLFENTDAQAKHHLNHIGVECEDRSALETAAIHMTAKGLTPGNILKTGCCHATQDKMWITGPDDLSWEWYHVLDDNPDPEFALDKAPTTKCCGTEIKPDTTCCA
ncbi:ArsI/CadI family heavy metal resistance metalloenzyme [Thalassospira alkalitolerans]|uniref:Glyoxalase/bleomycin resistance protein/dioxygenase n=1 Tax=Thalassospira alkalitolerans TaxID=1293890 RepID=A0A1Y2LJL6_9PROT|nr:ArsI/CadI family heavy metal resistance metalloenzyme [Thalassospira alkalitolerans]OSQ50414.1 glyoxalase/bleomycin resistance protein/dioxygenase [Thalassospira alkalitolerans]